MRRFVPSLLCIAVLIGCTDKEADSGHVEHGDDGGDGGDGSDSASAMTDGDTWMVSYALGVEEIPLSEEFSLTLTVMEAATEAPATDVELTASAEMPTHGHGMNQEPIVTRNGDGSFLVEGMLFHMEGDWELVVGVSDGSTSEIARIGIPCCS